MVLKLYYQYPFVPDHEITQVDLFTGDGINATFNLKNKTAPRCGGSLQFDQNVSQRYLNGFSFPTASSVTLSYIPPLNSQGVVPGITGLNFTAFDTLSEPGQPSPANADTETFYLADDGLDAANIYTNTYEAVSGNPGIAILFTNVVTAAGASLTWTQLACADASGNPLTFQATGTTLYTDRIGALTTVAASTASLATSMQVLSASGMYPGDYFKINPGQATEENPKILTVNYGTGVITTTGFNNNHFVGELIFINGRRFYGKAVIPLGSLGGLSQMYINLAITYDCLMVAR